MPICGITVPLIMLIAGGCTTNESMFGGVFTIDFSDEISWNGESLGSAYL